MVQKFEGYYKLLAIRHPKTVRICCCDQSYY